MQTQADRRRVQAGKFMQKCEGRVGLALEQLLHAAVDVLQHALFAFVALAPRVVEVAEDDVEEARVDLPLANERGPL